MFFANWVAADRPTGSALLKLADNDGHNTDSIDGMINVVPTTLQYFAAKLLTGSIQRTSEEKTDQHAGVSFVINAIRRSQTLPKYGIVLHELLWDILSSHTDSSTPGERLRDAIRRILPVIGEVTGLLLTTEQLERQPDPMTACYIESAFPALLVFAYKYADDPKRCWLASVNAGGENVNRGAVLGAILGAAYGWDTLEQLQFDGGVGMIAGLVAKRDIELEISMLVEKIQARAGEDEVKSELRI